MHCEQLYDGALKRGFNAEELTAKYKEALGFMECL
jgi:hypothetical protein